MRKRGGPRRPPRRRLIVLVFLLGFSAGLGVAYGGYKLQHTYVMVENKDLVEFVQRYNALVTKCFHSEPL